MRIAGWAIGIAFLGVFLVGTVHGQTGLEPPLIQPQSVRSTGFEYEGNLAAVAPEPGKKGPVATPSEAAPPAAPLEVSEGAGAEDSDAPWKLPQPALFQRAGINMGGWIQQGITFNAQKPADRFNGTVTTNDRDREWQLNQAWLYFMRPTKTDGCGWDLGGRIDAVYGTDWRFGMNYGLEDQINSNQNFYGLILPQFYMEVAVNDLTVKMGHFATMTAYEVIPPVANFFYSHSYLMAGYSDPLLVTGLQADYKVNDRLTLVGGFHRGWMMFEDLNDDLDFLGGVKWKSDDQRTGMSFMVDTGAQDLAGVNNRFTYMLVLTQQMSEKASVALQHNYGVENNGSWATQGEDAEWYGVAGWLTYTFNPCWSAGLRLEWLRDDDGSRVAGVGNWIGSGRGWLGAPGFAGNFYDLTLGLNWRPHANWTVRPEVRWDWYDGTRNLAGQFPFDAGNQRDQFTFAVDVLTTF